VGVYATSLAKGNVDLTIKEIAFCRAGRAVKVEGLGIFTPFIDLDGMLSISFRADIVPRGARSEWDASMTYYLNMPGTFTGTILNREFIGKSSADLIARWNEENPADMVVTD
jgi:hypothetical protein